MQLLYNCFLAQKACICLEAIVQTYALELAAGWCWLRSWRDSCSLELKEPLLDVQERRNSQNLGTTAVVLHFLKSLSPYLPWARQGISWHTAMLLSAAPAQELEQVWNLQSLSFSPVMTTFRWWFPLFHTTYYFKNLWLLVSIQMYSKHCVHKSSKHPNVRAQNLRSGFITTYLFWSIYSAFLFPRFQWEFHSRWKDIAHSECLQSISGRK